MKHDDPLPVRSGRRLAPLVLPLIGAAVLLRPFEPGDREAIHAVYADASVMRWVGAGPVGEAAETERMLDEYHAHQRMHGFSFWAVVERSTSLLVGDAGLYTRDGEVELGYTLARAVWGRGYGTEAAQLCVAAAFGPLNLDALVATVRPENVASAAILTKLGFRADGLVTAYGQPHDLYRLRRRDRGRY